LIDRWIDGEIIEFLWHSMFLQKIPERSIILLHACAHNPTGVDPSVRLFDIGINLATLSVLLLWQFGNFYAILSRTVCIQYVFALNC